MNPRTLFSPWFAKCGRPRARRRRNGFPKIQPVQVLEDRALLATFVVTNTNDSGDGSLRKAIQDSNSAQGADLISFDIAGTGVHSIRLQSRLPTVTDTVTIDGWTQSGFTGSPRIVLDGTNAGAGMDGLIVNRSGSSDPSSTVIRGLVIQSFDRYGIFVIDVANVTIEGNYIGTDSTGNFARPNKTAGIVLSRTTETRIGVAVGSSQPARERNVISGNSGDGVWLSAASNNVMAGNMIGVNAAGTAALPNADDGIQIVASSSGVMSTGNVIGGDFAARRNVISGNGDTGIVISGSSDNTITGNYIGVAADGMTALGNADDGILVTANDAGVRADRNVIGGITPGEANVISGNAGDGIILWGASDTQIAANYIGVSLTGQTAVPNANGIRVYPTNEGVGALGNVIGGPDSQYTNVISGNTGYGILLNGALIEDTVIRNNLIGMAADQNTGVGNGFDGINVWGATRNLIDLNRISGNGGDGIDIGNGASEIVVTGNYVGFSDQGAVPNADHGIRLRGGATNNRIGGLLPTERNIISGNANFGVYLQEVGTSNNQIIGNFIGTNANGNSGLGNRLGIVVQDGASENIIGGSQPAAGNVISGNSEHGVWISGAGTNSNNLLGNFIGTTDTGNAKLGNQIGVVVKDGARLNRIGGPGTNERNVISGNRATGVWVGDFSTKDNLIQGNLIGTNLSGNADLGNGGDGIRFFTSGANQVGGTTAGTGNVIAASGSDGIDIRRGAQGISIQGNRIGVGLDGTTALGNAGEGVRIRGGDLQGNPPTIVYVLDVSTSTNDNFIGTPPGDVNGDGRTNSILDAELAGFIAFTTELIALGYGSTARVGITTFGSGANALDVNLGQPSVQLTTLIGEDHNNNGTPDVIDVLKTIRDGGGTSFPAGLRSAYDTFTSSGTLSGDGNLIFVSDGANNGGSFTSQLASLNSLNVNRIALGMGTSSDLTQLQQIDPDAVKVLSSDEFTSSLLSVLGLSGSQTGSSGPVGTNIVVGGTVAGAGNVIAYNGADGVDVENFLAVGNAILGNSIHSNGDLGIDLGRGGVTLNDALDADAGANQLTNFPVITSVSVQNNQITVAGTLSAEPNQTYRVEIFGNDTAETSQHGEGRYFLGFTNVTTNASGNGAFSRNLTGAATGVAFVTSTATDPNNNTSEFSAAMSSNRPPAGFAVSQSGGSTTVSESGGTDTFTVVLTSQPVSNVVMDITSSDVGEATVDRSRLTFTPANWNSPQTVTVSGINDSVTDGNQVSIVTVSVNDALSDNAFDALPDQLVSVTTTDVVTPNAGFSVSQTGGSTSVREDGTTDTISVVLTAQPAANVVFDIAGSDIGEATVSTSTLTFTPTNWNSPQIITVTGVSDGVVDGDQTSTVTISVNDALSDNAFDALVDQIVNVTTADVNVDSGKLQEISGDNLNIVPGGPVQFDVRYNTSDNVSALNGLSLRMHFDSSRLTYQNLTNVFSAGRQGQVFVGDDTENLDGDSTTDKYVAIDWVDAGVNWPGTQLPTRLFTAQFTAAASFSAGSSTTVNFSAPFTATDYGFSYTPVTLTASQAFLDANGDGIVSPLQDGILIVRHLLNQPNANLEGPLLIPAGSTRTTGAAVRQFLDTAVASGAFDANGDGVSNPLQDGILIVRYLLNQPDSNLEQSLLIPAGSTRTTGSEIRAFLDQWNLPVTSASLVALSDGPANFGASATDFADTVTTLTHDGAHQIVEAIASSSTVAVGNPLDINVSYTTDPVNTALNGLNLRLHFDSSKVSYMSTNVLLTQSQQGAPAVIDDSENLDNDAATDMYLQVDWVDFGLNWPGVTLPATLYGTTFTAIAEGQARFNLTSGFTATGFELLPSGTTIAVTARPPEIVISETGTGIVVNESGTTDTFAAALNMAPTGNVVIAVNSDNLNEVTVRPASLTFTPDNWNTSQTIIVTGVDDTPAVADGNQTTAVTLSVDRQNSDSVFANAANRTVMVTTNDNDVAALTLLITEDSILENGGVTMATVTRNTPTSDPLTVTLASSDNSKATVPASVVIPAGATISAPFTIAAVDNSVVDGTQTVTFTASVNGLASGIDTLNVIDDDAVVDLSAVLDLDRSGGAAAAQSDGLLIFAVLAGVTDSTQLNNFRSPSATRTAADVATSVNELKASLVLDVDGNNAVGAQSDGLLIFAVLAGVTDEIQLAALIAPGAPNSPAQVIAAVEALRHPSGTTAAFMPGFSAAVVSQSPVLTIDSGQNRELIAETTATSSVNLNSKSDKNVASSIPARSTPIWSAPASASDAANDSLIPLDDFFRLLPEEEELLFFG